MIKGDFFVMDIAVKLLDRKTIISLEDRGLSALLTMRQKTFL